MIDDNVKEISEYAFQYSKIENITFPQGLETIEDSAFMYGSLKEVIIPKNVTYIGYNAFCENTNLIYLNILSSNLEMDNACFSGCESLKEIKISEGLKEIKNGTFSLCSNLEKVELPLSLKTIAIAAFFMCDKLKTVVYNGTKQDREKMVIWDSNDALLNAEWVYKQ